MGFMSVNRNHWAGNFWAALHIIDWMNLPQKLEQSRFTIIRSGPDKNII